MEGKFCRRFGLPNFCQIPLLPLQCDASATSGLCKWRTKTLDTASVNMKNTTSAASAAAYLNQSEIRRLYGDIFVTDSLLPGAMAGCDGIEEIVCAYDKNVIVRRVFAAEPETACFVLHGPLTEGHKYYCERFQLVPGVKVVLKQKWVLDRWVDFT
jgi:hypothetical protein